ncbi:hypothetical protein [Nodosilinea nodulosa]|uniref:hypothetical protein n=1 Tax=Nodosilinea nodulosa TaxID=416001 RepID=UPI0012D83641|nr:hypothetical protein [Nodosilinea nodulosa]
MFDYHVIHAESTGCFETYCTTNRQVALAAMADGAEVQVSMRQPIVRPVPSDYDLIAF